MGTASGLERIQLLQLDPSKTKVFLVGIIIAKQRPRKFEAKGGSSKEAAERAVWNFTFRDSPLCYINVTCWGTKVNIFELNEKFKVGEVVNIFQPQIEIRKLNDYGENFRPQVTSPYALTLMDATVSSIIHYTENCQAFLQLLHLPTKPIAGAVTLADVHNIKERTEGKDILGIVRLIGKARNITMRDGTQQQVREVVIFDQTSPALRITLWEPDFIARAATWKISHTVLFITNVRCEWSNFARSVTATLTARSVVTEDPAAKQTENLRKYASETPLQPSAMLNQIAGSISNASKTIQNVMNVQQVLDRVETIINSTNIATEQQFTALLYAVVTQLDLDGLSRLTSTTCSCCDTVIDEITCVNTNCPVASGQEPNNPITNFDLRLMLSDQTGSLFNCRLNGQTAEAVLNCTVQEFLAMSDEDKSILKWHLLMERCAVRIFVMCTGFRNSMISVLSCELAAPLEVANRLPHY